MCARARATARAGEWRQMFTAKKNRQQPDKARKARVSLLSLKRQQAHRSASHVNPQHARPHMCRCVNDSIMGPINLAESPSLVRSFPARCSPGVAEGGSGLHRAPLSDPTSAARIPRVFPGLMSDQEFRATVEERKTLNAHQRQSDSIYMHG